MGFQCTPSSLQKMACFETTHFAVVARCMFFFSFLPYPAIALSGKRACNSSHINHGKCLAMNMSLSSMWNLWKSMGCQWRNGDGTCWVHTSPWKVASVWVLTCLHRVSSAHYTHWFLLTPVGNSVSNVPENFNLLTPRLEWLFFLRRFIATHVTSKPNI